MYVFRWLMVLWSFQLGKKITFLLMKGFYYILPLPQDYVRMIGLFLTGFITVLLAGWIAPEQKLKTGFGICILAAIMILLNFQPLIGDTSKTLFERSLILFLIPGAALGLYLIYRITKNQNQSEEAGISDSQ